MSMRSRDLLIRLRPALVAAAASVALLATVASSIASPRAAPAAAFDVVLRHGTILDGTGAARYRGDIGIIGDRIARVGDLSASRGSLDLDVRGLLVAPGFINIHSHAMTLALPSAENMLTQGVTTEILNPDGGGPIDIAQQLSTLAGAGLAVNVGAYIGFNAIWASVVGAADRRPAPAAIDSMRALLVAGMDHGAFGVSAGLDYKPAYYATTDEVIAVVEAARKRRTNFTNHDRLTPDSGYSSRVGMAETMRIGERTGLVPVFTHMKVQGHEQGSASAVLDTMRRATARGVYVTADAYPYLAGQTALVALIVPGWAQDGGRSKMLERFRDPALRERIVAEANDAITARFGGAQGVYLPAARRELADTMRDMQVTSPGEAVVRLLEDQSPTAILRFGAEDDLVKILKYPATSIACDCGASPPSTRGHPRNYGTFPRVLGHYVRETKALTWEDAIRKMTGLPASTIGLVDRGFLVPGMAADITIFDSSTVIDHATYEDPARLSEGIRFVLVNGHLALRDGTPTGDRGGRALVRASNMPSRPMQLARARHVAAKGTIDDQSPPPEGGNAPRRVEVAFDVSQRAGGRQPTGSFRLTDTRRKVAITASQLGLLQTGERWATFTGRARVRPLGAERAFTVIVEQGDPSVPGPQVSVTIDVDGLNRVSGRLTPNRVNLTTGR
jgi:N-acyl-D-amino-acid deacylase